jgi:hypothetical protein
LLATRLAGVAEIKQEVLSAPGRFKVIQENLHAKEVVVGDGERRRRYVLCYNPKEAERQQHLRAQRVEELEAELACSQSWFRIRHTLDALQATEFHTPTQRFFCMNEVSQPVRQTFVTFVAPDPGDFYQPNVRSTVNLGTRNHRSFWQHLDGARQVVKEPHAIQVAHGARLAFLKVQDHSSGASIELIE